ncbi:MAG: hypothetical protein KKG62_03560 [Actinobacteria bacterium]|nr:hypothetical protein [Actinomycetota bacterium]
MKIEEIILQCLRVVLNWPLVAIIPIFLFKKQISDFLSRLIRGKIGNLSVEATPPKQEKVIIENNNKNPLIQMMKDDPENAYHEILKLYEDYFYERSFNIIYGTQINLLDHLDKKPDKSEKYNFIFIKFYFKHLGRKPKTKKPYNQYLDFLEINKFIEILNANKTNNEKILKITPSGIKYLSYIKTHYPERYKNKPF